jgi:glycosyltransferase involved in cell wall biosynthesis
MAVLLDIQGVQSRAHGERGIARYLIELANALELNRPDLLSQLVLNHELPVPAAVEPLSRSGKLVFADRIQPRGRTIYHVGSPGELEVPIDSLWPEAVRRLRFAVTVYDVIPLLFPDIYLRDPWQRRRYEARLELIRRADLVLAISETTAADSIEHLRVPPERVVVVGAGVSHRFQRAESRAAAAEAALRDMPWLSPKFVLYAGGIEPRKNIDRLLRAYAGLPNEVRSNHQLVVVCRVDPVDGERLDEELRALGIAESVHFPGYVPDEQLVRLYQAARLVVFPSLYEGFGLPVAEALACGAAVVTSETPALAELVDDPAARFDPQDIRDIRATIERFLTDEASLDRLRAKRLDPTFSWEAVAMRTAAAYERLLRLPERRRPRPRVAWVSPFPPQPTGVADESYHVLEQLARRCDIDAYPDGPAKGEPQVPERVTVKALERFERAERAHGGYDRVFYCLGNSEYHTGALALLGRRPGVVIAHDVRLNGLYTWRAHERPDLDPRPFQEIVQAMYPGRLPLEVGQHGWISLEDADRFGIFMAREAIASAQRFLVHSRHAAQVARLEASSGHESKVDVIPFGVIAPEEVRSSAPRDDPPLVATFGHVGGTKQVAKVVAAFSYVLARVEAKLAIVGPHTDPGERGRLARQADGLKIADRFEQTGYVEEDDLADWLARTTVAVQLRATSNGETSAAVATCLAAGVPTIVTDIGSAAELPDEAVVKVDRVIPQQSLGEVIADLIADVDRRAEMAAASIAWARAHTHEKVAKALYRVVLSG